MLPDRVSNPGPLTYESGALPIALRGPARKNKKKIYKKTVNFEHTFHSGPGYSKLTTSLVIVSLKFQT